MKYRIKSTTSFKKDLQKLAKRNLPLQELKYVIDILSKGEQLPEKYRDHQLKGNLKDFRECHIRPDWLLIYQKKDDELILILSRTGSHSDLL